MAFLIKGVGKLGEHTCSQIKPVNEIKVEIGKIGQRVDALEKYNIQQNGAISRIEVKVDKLDDKIDDLQTWMLNTLVKVSSMFGVFVLGLVAWLIQRC